MGQLTNQYVSQSFQGLLKLEDSTTGVTGTLQYVQDGVGNNLPIQVSTSSVVITGSFSGDGSGLTGITTTSASFATNATSASFSENSNLLDGKDSSEFATTGSNTFQGNQTINGDLDVTGSLTASGLVYPINDGVADMFLETDGNGNLIFDWVKTLHQNIRNVDSVTISRGTPLFVSGSTGDNADVYVADAGNPLRRPATLIAFDQTLAPSATGTAIISGEIQGVNTIGYPAGTVVYLASGGGWTDTRPTGSASVQPLGVVTSEANNGRGIVFNQVADSLPNLPSDNVWLGNVNGVPTAVDKDTLGFATTGSNNFVGQQNINGNVIVTGSITSTQEVNAGNGVYTSFVQGQSSLNLNATNFVDIKSNTSGVSKKVRIYNNDSSDKNIPVEITGSLNVTAGVTGSFYGDGSGLTGVTAAPADNVATTGSNTFIGNQVISGSIDVENSLNVNGNSTYNNQTTYNNTIQYNADSFIKSGSQLNFNIGDGEDGAYYRVSRKVSGVFGIVQDPGNHHLLDISTGSATFETPVVLLSGATGSFYGDGSGLTGVTAAPPDNMATTGSNVFIGNQVITGSILQSGSLPNEMTPLQIARSNKAYFGEANTLLSLVGDTQGIFDFYADGGNYDTLNINLVQNSGTTFRDWTGAAYSNWMVIPTNTGNNPAPQFKRGLTVTGSLITSGSVHNIIGNTNMTGALLQSSSLPNELTRVQIARSNKAFFGDANTLLTLVGDTVGKMDFYADGGNYDTLNIVVTQNSGSSFNDYNGSTYPSWLKIPTNTGANPAPQFQRGLTISGSLITSGSATITGSVNISSVMKLQALDPLPAGGLGELAVSSSNELYFHNGTNWNLIS